MEVGDSHTFRYRDYYDRRKMSMVAHNTKRKYGWSFSVKTNDHNLTVSRTK